MPYNLRTKENKYKNILEKKIKNQFEFEQSIVDKKNNELITSSKSQLGLEKYKEESKNLINSNKSKEYFKGRKNDFTIKYKTELCKNYEYYGFCKYEDNCAYAHGKENLRAKVTNTTFFRTKKCESFFSLGYCPYGSRCQFAHQFHSNITNNPYDIRMTYSDRLKILNKMNKDNMNNIKMLLEKPRLTCFNEIIKNSKNSKSVLLNDIKNLIIIDFKVK